jgi:hypothetical protein
LLDFLFPKAPAKFSSVEIKQMKTAFEQGLAEMTANQNANSLSSNNTAFYEYITSYDPEVPDQLDSVNLLGTLRTDTIKLAETMSGNDPKHKTDYRYTAGFLAAAAQHMLSLQLLYKAEHDSKNTSRYGKSFLTEMEEYAIATLDKLVDLQRQYFEDSDLEVFSDFMGHVLFGLAKNDAIRPWFGDDYRGNVIALLRFAESFSLDNFDTVQMPKYHLWFVEPDKTGNNHFERTWFDGETSHQGNIAMFLSGAPFTINFDLLAGDQNDAKATVHQQFGSYAPIGDVCVTNYTPTLKLPFVRAY